jgi:hypothetical protein
VSGEHFLNNPELSRYTDWFYMRNFKEYYQTRESREVQSSEFDRRLLGLRQLWAVHEAKRALRQADPTHRSLGERALGMLKATVVYIDRKPYIVADSASIVIVYPLEIPSNTQPTDELE